jgi:hypothetical protein
MINCEQNVKEVVMAYFSVIAWYSPAGTDEKRENLGQDNRCPDRDSN